MKRLILYISGAALALLLFASGLRTLSHTADTQGRQRLETALRQAAAACYAAEGVYPPSVAYLQQHYGLQIDQDRYLVDYQPVADNLMPDITVLERE